MKLLARRSPGWNNLAGRSHQPSKIVAEAQVRGPAQLLIDGTKAFGRGTAHVMDSHSRAASTFVMGSGGMYLVGLVGAPVVGLTGGAAAIAALAAFPIGAIWRGRELGQRDGVLPQPQPLQERRRQLRAQAKDELAPQPS